MRAKLEAHQFLLLALHDVTAPVLLRLRGRLRPLGSQGSPFPSSSESTGAVMSKISPSFLFETETPSESTRLAADVWASASAHRFGRSFRIRQVGKFLHEQLLIRSASRGQCQEIFREILRTVGRVDERMKKSLCLRPINRARCAVHPAGLLLEKYVEFRHAGRRESNSRRGLREHLRGCSEYPPTRLERATQEAPRPSFPRRRKSRGACPRS